MRNIAAALARSREGDTIIVAAGFYQELNWFPSGQHLELPATGAVYISDSDPNQNDSDQDGIPDGWEAKFGLNPFDNLDAVQTSAVPWAHGLSNVQVYQHPNVLLADNYSTGRDGLPDWWKIKCGLPLKNPSLPADDADHDGYINLHEYESGTSPQIVADHPHGCLPDIAGWWPFDEGIGSQTFSLVGTNLTGTLVGNPPPAWTSGIFSNALEFDGAQNEVVITDSLQLSPTNALSITAWVKTRLNLTSEVAAKWSTHTTTGSYLLSLTNGQVMLELMLDGHYSVVVGAAAELIDMDWHHIAGTYDGTRLQVFLDGECVGAQMASGTVDVVAEPLRLGLMAGQLDDVRLYNLALSASAVAGLSDADLNEDGTPDALEVNMDADVDADGDGYTNLQEYRSATDPHDYYNGVLPVLLLTSGGGQVGITNQILGDRIVCWVGDQNGMILVNAPVWITTSAGLLSTASNGLYSTTIPLRTDQNGKIEVWLQVADSWATTSRITIQAISGTSSTHLSVEARTCSVSEDSDNDHIPDWWMQEHFGHMSSQAYDHSFASDDPDEDGYTNLQEFHAGTDPNNQANIPADLPRDLAGWWRFDDGSGSNAVDSSGNSQIGVLIGNSLPLWKSGVNSNALRFDGIQSGVVVSNSPILNPAKGLTLITWIKTQASTGIIASKWSKNGEKGSFRLRLVSSQAVLELMCDGNYAAVAGQAGVMADSNWHQLVGTYDGTQLVLSIDSKVISFFADHSG